eukprot:jgi/Tetstr1/461485/TSEL_006591.t1
MRKPVTRHLLTDDKKRKRPVKKRRGKKLTVAESEAESEAQAEAEAEAEAEAARSSKRRVPRARKNKNKHRIELQPDSVGANAAVQPEQQDDEASEVELPELVADSEDDEEDFVPCWEEDDSNDDDDVYEELTIMTQTEPEVEAALDSEPPAAGACYALRAEDPSADNLYEPDCPSNDVELEDGTAMPLREHEDEIPDWRELRRQHQAAGRLHLSGHTHERLALVRAVPHSTPELTKIIDLDRTGGKEGRAKQGLFLFAGMLSVLFTNLVDGYHYEMIQIVDRMLRSAAHPQRMLQQLEWMHQRWPVQLPRNAFEKCFDLSDELEHDVEHITAPTILRHLPEVDELHAEPPCQDVSSMGTQHGLRAGARTGVIVPLATAISELDYMLAKARGVKEYWAAPAQYGYVIENVIPAAPSRRSIELHELIDFIARVFSEPNVHHAHKCGDASLRSALWWTNTFTQHYYRAVQHEFERPPRETYAQIVERCSDSTVVQPVGWDITAFWNSWEESRCAPLSALAAGAAADPREGMMRPPALGACMHAASSGVISFLMMWRNIGKTLCAKASN